MRESRKIVEEDLEKENDFKKLDRKNQFKSVANKKEVI